MQPIRKQPKPKQGKSPLPNSQKPLTNHYPTQPKAAKLCTPQTKTKSTTYNTEPPQTSNPSANHAHTKRSARKHQTQHPNQPTRTQTPHNTPLSVNPKHQSKPPTLKSKRQEQALHQRLQNTNTSVYRNHKQCLNHTTQQVSINQPTKTPNQNHLNAPS